VGNIPGSGTGCEQHMVAVGDLDYDWRERDNEKQEQHAVFEIILGREVYAIDPALSVRYERG